MLQKHDEQTSSPVAFDLRLPGYAPSQVRKYLQGVETEVRMLVVDRDAAVSQTERLVELLEAVRGENRALRAQVDRICRTPLDPGGLAERMVRMVELAMDEAAEITAAARAADAEAEGSRRRIQEQFEVAMAARRTVDDELARHVVAEVEREYEVFRTFRGEVKDQVDEALRQVAELECTLLRNSETAQPMPGK